MKVFTLRVYQVSPGAVFSINHTWESCFLGPQNQAIWQFSVFMFKILSDIQSTLSSQGVLFGLVFTKANLQEMLDDVSRTGGTNT